jgi:hypothetical protein
LIKFTKSIALCKSIFNPFKDLFHLSWLLKPQNPKTPKPQNPGE